ncbi:DUF5691 domain-containing protein [Trichocoleus sp. FACHB-262]|uniref:DUF5691 domain-containing protein n=1 Tax=Trichocoleus sp. FACHB-262 TaxID=2692869 RepID=UPI001681F3C3|nr:DUF5691 domain-containing protein [Trichocoleus sp. FACHB-262]MBD2120925.1 hypothetical protein [Trichocoleus sp. FACHB-262]
MTSLWEALVTAALLGTERQAFTPPAEAGLLGKLLSRLDAANPEAALLSAAATVSLHQQVGQLPAIARQPLPTACDLDDLPRCSPQAGHHLSLMLSGDYAKVLPEWLAAVAAAGQRVPESNLPALLDLGQRKTDLQTAIAPVLGKRGQWLAAQNPDWNFVTGAEDDASWETGNRAARKALLNRWRSQDPERARHALEATWKQETAAEKAAFLETFSTQLSLADEPFLESALSDRSKDVRRVAADLLARLPDSRLCQRMTERVHRYIKFGPNQTLEVTLPEALDPDLLRDGIEPKVPYNYSMGEKAWWLLQIVAATPLRVWTQTQCAPEVLVQAAVQSEWTPVFWQGWKQATIRQRSPTWVPALLEFHLATTQDVTYLQDEDLQQLMALLLEAEQEALALNHLQIKGIENSAVLRLLYQVRSAWSIQLGRAVLDALYQYITVLEAQPLWHLLEALKEFALWIPPSLLTEAIPLAAAIENRSNWAASTDQGCWSREIEKFLALLQFRQDMLQAITQQSK